jgi:hypothetical protein
MKKYYIAGLIILLILLYLYLAPTVYSEAIEVYCASPQLAELYTCIYLPSV